MVMSNIEKMWFWFSLLSFPVLFVSSFYQLGYFFGGWLASNSVNFAEVELWRLAIIGITMLFAFEFRRTLHKAKILFAQRFL